jgi:GR25 family glycosyltransferase involved in LPS biosynthesis
LATSSKRLTFTASVEILLAQSNTLYMNTKAFVISLPSRVERLDCFYKHAYEHGWEVCTWAACDGSRFHRTKDGWLVGDDLPDCAKWSLKRPDWHEPLKPGEVGLAVSTICLLRHAKEEKVDCLVVFEDDAIITGPPEFDVPADADICFVGNRWSRDSRGRTWGYGCGTEGYVVMKKGFDKLLKLYEYVNLPIDLLMIAHMDSMVESGHSLCQFRRPEVPLLKCVVGGQLCYHDERFGSDIKNVGAWSLA